MSKKEKKQSKPETDEAKAIKKDIGNYAALEALQNSDGGILLISSLKKDAAACLDEIAAKYRTATHAELVAICARLSEKVLILRSFTRASKNKRMAEEELNVLLKEEDE